MPDLTLYSEDVLMLKMALTVATARYERQGLMGFADECDKLWDKLSDRLAQGLHPERPTQGESD